MIIDTRQAPAALKWTWKANSPSVREAMQSILLVMCPKTQSKGTGFVLKSGCVVTTAHVVEGCRPREIVAIDASGTRLTFSKVVADDQVDLALLRLTKARRGGLELASNVSPELGSPVWAWGFPFGYVGPAPLVSVGHIAGYSAKMVRRRPVKHVVVNGAFNVGNSGGPLCSIGSTEVLGVVASKHVPLSPFVESALKALAGNKSGAQFMAMNALGRSRKFTQSELVAEVFAQYRDFLQVMIGEAVAASEVSRFLSAHAHEILAPRRKRNRPARRAGR